MIQVEGFQNSASCISENLEIFIVFAYASVSLLFQEPSFKEVIGLLKKGTEKIRFLLKKVTSTAECHY